MNATHTYNLGNLPVDKTNWEKLRKLTDSEVTKAANTDPDCQALIKN